MMHMEDVMINNQKTKWMVEDEPSVLAAGYILTPEGKFLTISDCDDHSNIFTLYLNAFFNNQLYYDIITGGKALIENNHIVYCGLKPQDFRNSEIKVYKGLMLFPKDLDKCSLELLKSTLQLLQTNRSIFGGEKIPIDCHFGFDETPYMSTEVMKILERKVI
ncbi:TPA: hypothetical protein IAB29_06275 [Candidatus Ventrenecus stercoripullorum]|nr:hypothetical protein [Candidatus Ventrenecus stercoripullorum]